LAHFVRGHSPYCTFCDIVQSPEQNPEKPLHLFFECTCVSELTEIMFRRLSGDENFNFSMREFFVNFERRGYTHPMNMALTIFAKFLIKYLWDCRNKFFIPNVEHCWDTLIDKITATAKTNGNFRTVWSNSGFQAVQINNEQY
jgi:hypothetical protein